MNSMYTFDPTKTLTLRRLFVEQFKLRFNDLIKVSNISIVTNDCFGNPIRNVTESNKVSVHDGLGYPTTGSGGYSQRAYPIPPRHFEFSTDEDKIEGYMKWFMEMITLTLYQTSSFDQISALRDPMWAYSYISNAYRRGMLWGRQNIRRNSELMRSLNLTPSQIPTDNIDINTSFSSIPHANRIAVLYSRVFNDLNGVTAQVDAEVTRILASSFLAGDNPRVIARSIADRVAKVGIHRATLLARTEVIRAHHLASIQTYKDFGVQGVAVKAEWKTAGDSRVCQLCAPLEGKVFTLKEVEGKIPVHPQCRCAALPVVVPTN